MGNRSPLQALASSPTMVGAITTLIVIVAVFLAYNANNGLPFVPTYRVNVEIPNASRLVRNNEVRIGGNRVGVVEAISLVKRTGDESAQGSSSDASSGGDSGAVLDSDTSVEQDPDVVARLTLKLDESVGSLPQNSIFRVRYKSAFGLKFLDITRGDSEGAPEGFTFDGTNDVDGPDDDSQILSLDEASTNPGAADGTFIEQTEFDDIGNTFDQRTRNAARQNLLGFGNALAGRGASLNLAVESLNPLFTNLKPVADVLADTSTRFRRLFPELGDAARIIAPVANEQADLFTNMSITFGAISSDVEKLQETITEGPPTLATGIEVLPAQQRFLASFTDLSERLRPGVRQLSLALPDLNSAVDNGTPVVARTPALNRRLEGVFTSLEDLVEQPTTLTTLQRLKQTFNKSDDLAGYIAPTQTVCNYFNYWTTLLPEHLSEKDSSGFTQRVSLIATPNGSVSANLGPAPLTIEGEVETGLAIGGYSGKQANGKAGAAPNPADAGFFDPREFPILHGDPGRPTGQNGSDCQGGQTGYPLGGNFRIPGQSPSNPAVGVPDLPGDRGPTTAFWEQDGTRIFKDTRVPARQP